MPFEIGLLVNTSSNMQDSPLNLRSHPAEARRTIVALILICSDSSRSDGYAECFAEVLSAHLQSVPTGASSAAGADTAQCPS